jgi:chemotaxis protein CheY-P-specific phosphatase CheC
MQLTRQVDLTRIEEIKILSDVRLIHRHDLNHISSEENLRVQFELMGDVQGSITCFLCLDGMELSEMERNYLFPLFTESMNILVGRQISLDQQLSKLKIRLSPPKLNMNSLEINTRRKSFSQHYELELSTMSLNVVMVSSIEFVN